MVLKYITELSEKIGYTRGEAGNIITFIAKYRYKIEQVDDWQPCRAADSPGNGLTTIEGDCESCMITLGES